VLPGVLDGDVAHGASDGPVAVLAFVELGVHVREDADAVALHVALVPVEGDLDDAVAGLLVDHALVVPEGEDVRDPVAGLGRIERHLVARDDVLLHAAAAETTESEDEPQAHSVSYR